MTDGGPRRVSRRRFVEAAGATGVIGVLAGCGSDTDGDGEDAGTEEEAGDGEETEGAEEDGEDGSTTVQFAADAALQDVQSEFVDALHEAGLSEDVDVEVLAGGAASDERRQQYTRWLSEGLEEPSLLRMDSGWTIPFVTRQHVANLSEELPDVTEEVKSDYVDQSVRTAMGPEGDLYGVPMFPDFGVMLYRKDLVEDAGFDPEGDDWATEPLTWREFAEVAEKTLEESDVEHGFTFQAADYEGLACCTFVEFMGSWGGSYFGDEENLFGPVGERDVTVDAEPTMQAVQMLRRFVDDDVEGELLTDEEFPGNFADRTVLQWREDESLGPFMDGDAVMHRNWPFAIPEAGADENLGADAVGVTPMPEGVPEEEAQFEGFGGSVSALGGWHVTLNPNAARKEAALEVIEAMTAEEVQLFLFEEVGLLPPREDLYEDERAREVEIVGEHMETLRVAAENSMPRPATVAWSLQSTQISQRINGAVAGQEDPEEALSNLQGELEAAEEDTAEDTGEEAQNETGDSEREGTITPENETGNGSDDGNETASDGESSDDGDDGNSSDGG